MHTLDLSTPGFDMAREAEKEFAALVEFVLTRAKNGCTL